MRSVPPASLLPCFLALMTACTGSEEVASDQRPPGREESATTEVLETGATLLQRDAPTDELNVYLVGFHPLKSDPSHQFEAHHFCSQVNEDFMQCALFDGNTQGARLNGLEYIVSRTLFEQLPEQEQQYWHPHNGEILSGQLVAPGIPESADHALMRSKINSYGKTWHTWSTGNGSAALPLGAPMLAWSFNRFGEPRQELVESRDRRMGIDTQERRRAREDLIPLAEPQEGVDTLKGRFPGPTRPIPGVTDAKASPPDGKEP